MLLRGLRYLQKRLAGGQESPVCLLAVQPFVSFSLKMCLVILQDGRLTTEDSVKFEISDLRFEIFLKPLCPLL